MECKICGKDFELKVDNHYIVRDEEIQRLGIASIVGSNTEKESKLYDAFNCPYCGCQNVVQERKRPAFVGSDYIGKIDDGYVEGVEEETEEESCGESTENMINCRHYHCADCQHEPHCNWAVNDNKETEVEVRG